MLLDWASESAHCGFTAILHWVDLAADLVAQPIQAYREFVAKFIHELQWGLYRIAQGEQERLELTMVIKFESDRPKERAFVRELNRLARR